MKQLFFIFTASLLCACSSSTYYQLYKVSTNGLERKNNLLTFENEHCIVSYDLWGEKGDLSFTLFNKTDEDVFVIMPRSFFIKNGIAYDYYTNSINVSHQVAQTGKSTSFAYANTLATIYAQSAITETTTTMEMEAICIPPKSTKFFKGFNLVQHAYKDCDNHDFNYPTNSSNIIRYNKEESPWNFRNRIAYTFGNENNDCLYIENELWVSSLQNYYQSAMQETIEVDECEKKTPVKKTIITNQSPSSFYNIYEKTAKSGKGGLLIVATLLLLLAIGIQ